ncbi:MAG: aldehyde ferredoxin oxidoreductase family protein [Planctomycetes bacterium]|nr:aldehyde ferredoxin oxidoreductase family protein [Planctomycetota bacterium]
MKTKGGYFHRILDVDLTTGKAMARPFDDEFALRYVGGRGFGARSVADNLAAHGGRVNPLGPENILVVAPGPLTGTYLPAAGKCSFITMSPATGIYADSSMGGSFCVELRQAGYDALVLRGAAPKLSYLWIDEERVQVVPCPELAGKRCLEAEGAIKEAVGDAAVKVISIGPAGENRVLIACITGDWGRQSGRTGTGAVMGSKNLKAIVVRGGKDLPVADVPKMREIGDRGYATLRAHPLFPLWQEQGLMSVIDYANSMGFLPTRNFRDGHFDEAERMDGFVMKSRYKIGDGACFGCPMCCSNICLVREGKYAGTVVEGPEYETAAMLGPDVGVSDFAAILRSNQLCDELGIDTISAGSLIAAVIEGYETGLLSLDDVDGRPLRWGDADAVHELIAKIARREGIGNTLADGSPGVIKRFPQLKPLLLQVKGLEQSAYDCRCAISMALAYGTSDIGAHHARAWTIAKELEMGRDWSLEKKADLVIYHQTIRPLFDMLGVCRLPWIELGFDERYYAEMFEAVTGVPTKLDDLLARSRAIYDLTRRIAVSHGVSRKDDYPPDRTFDHPVETGPLAGHVLSRADYDRILDIYYAKRGWSPDGIPPAE